MPPTKGLGFGNSDSGWNLHLESFITTNCDCCDGCEFRFDVGPLGGPLDDNVYELGSKFDLMGACAVGARETGGGGAEGDGDGELYEFDWLGGGGADGG